jgi:hypothetical protein
MCPWLVLLRYLGLRAYVSSVDPSGSTPGRSAIAVQWLRGCGVALPVAVRMGGRIASTATLRTLAVARRLDRVEVGGGAGGVSSWEIASGGLSFEVCPRCARFVTALSPRVEGLSRSGAVGDLHGDRRA